MDQDQVERRRTWPALQSLSGCWSRWYVGVWGLGRSTGQKRSLEMELWYVTSVTFSIAFFLKKTRLKLKCLLTGWRFFLFFQVSHSWSKIKSRGGPPALFGHSAIKVCLESIYACISFSRLLLINWYLPSNRFRLVYMRQELNEF